MTQPTPVPSQPDHRYTAAFANEIEPKWHRVWADERLYRVPNPGDEGFDATKPKFYALDMFPYPSGAGLHVGHPEGYTATDIVSRYKRMRGFNVLHPMGWDAFGLPAEQHAIKTGEHPASFTRKTIDTFRAQLQRFGFCYDWDREFATIDEDYYRWTQWIFLRLYNAWYDTAQNRARPIAELIEQFESGARPPRYNPDASEVSNDQHARTLGPWDTLSRATKHAIIASYRLAFVGEQTVNWCPKLGTALSNEEVIDGRSERGGFPVVRAPLKQWLLRITAFAERLRTGLDDLDWPDSTKAQQAEWIGRSEGAEILFQLTDAPKGFSGPLRVYTTRPDTLFGATFMVVAPEHPLVDAALRHTPTETVEAYVKQARNRSDVERQESKEKTGVALGVHAINPATGDPIPVWVADYVLMGYGTGAIMAVPSGDDRDFEFAKAFGLPIKDVVYPLAVQAMVYFAKHATDEEAADPDWRIRVADMMGYAVTMGDNPDALPEVLEIVRSRRQGNGGPPTSGRGAVRAEYLTEIEAIAPDFASFRARFVDGQHWAQAGQAFTGAGRAVNSSNAKVSLDGLRVPEAKERMTAWLAAEGLGTRKINYRLRDWLFSRQRYWGEPFPIVYDADGLHHGLGDDALPLVLPPLTDYAPEESDTPKPLLARATEWVSTTAGAAHVPDMREDAPVTREVNTMPGWAGSCWYHLRYADAKNDANAIGANADAYWMGDGGVDLYIGGAEHAVLHLLYARFWHMALHDLGFVKSKEPYRKLFHQGLITSFAFQRKDKSLVPTDEVENTGTDEKPQWVERATGEKVRQITAKMSKSLKNVVNPDDIIAEYGADTFRLYEMYMGPLEQSKPWNTKDTIGLFRFLQKLWRLVIDDQTGEPKLATDADPQIEKRLHRTIKKVGDDIEKLGFNTAIASMIEFVNASTPSDGSPTLTLGQAERLCRILSPFAPHLAEELWDRLGLRASKGSVVTQEWPEIDPAMLVDDEVEIPVQIMGKVRAKITASPDATAEQLQELALADERIKAFIEGKTIRKIVAVPGRMVNIVAT